MEKVVFGDGCLVGMNMNKGKCKIYYDFNKFDFMKQTMLFALVPNNKFYFVADKKKTVIKVINILNGIALQWGKGMPEKIYVLQAESGEIVEYSKNKPVVKLEYGDRVV